MELKTINIILDFFALAVLAVIWFADTKTSVGVLNRRIFRSMQIAISTCLGADAVVYLLYNSTGSGLWYFSLFANSVYYISQVVFCWLWFLYNYKRLLKKPLSGPRVREFVLAVPMVAEYCVITFLNPFNGAVFYIDNNCIYHRGSFFELNELFCYFYVVAGFVLAGIKAYEDRKSKEARRSSNLILLSIIPLFAALIQSFSEFPFAFTWPTIAMIIYTVYQSEAQNAIEQAKLTAATLEAELSSQRIKVMMSQIQPHFLYNTLTTIRALCGTDPGKAQEVITTFSNYLRTNMDSMNLTTPVPFSKELEHAKAYISIEQIRFPDLCIEYDVQDDGFCLPALTVQPMIENAIKHGIRKRTEPGGKIVVHTYNTGSNHIVEIIDNGAGFDDTEVPDTSRSHIGVSNTRKRIEEMMGGIFEIESKKGEGTTVTFMIPCVEEENGQTASLGML